MDCLCTFTKVGNGCGSAIAHHPTYPTKEE